MSTRDQENKDKSRIHSSTGQQAKAEAPRLKPPAREVTPENMARLPPLNLIPNLKFGPFSISASQVFHLSPSRLTYGLVNLKPLLPGHILICPVRNVPRLSQLTINETTDLFMTVRQVSKTLERLYQATSFNVAVQDGADAGQSVPHVHVHIIPRVAGDMNNQPGGGDALYEMMDGPEGDVGAAFVLADWLKRRDEARRSQKEFAGPDVASERVPRSSEEMQNEAEWLRVEIMKDEEKTQQQQEQEHHQPKQRTNTTAGAATHSPSPGQEADADTNSDRDNQSDADTDNTTTDTGNNVKSKANADSDIKMVSDSENVINVTPRGKASYNDNQNNNDGKVNDKHKVNERDRDEDSILRRSSSFSPSSAGGGAKVNHTMS